MRRVLRGGCSAVTNAAPPVGVRGVDSPEPSSRCRMRSLMLFSVALCLLVSTASPAADDKAAQPSKDSYVKVRVEVEVRGVLTASDKAVTVAARDRLYNLFRDADEIPREGTPATVYTLDFVRAKDLRELAKALDGKEVVVTGMSELRMVVQ